MQLAVVCSCSRVYEGMGSNAQSSNHEKSTRPTAAVLHLLHAGRASLQGQLA
jgi:hypothetical protein